MRRSVLCVTFEIRDSTRLETMFQVRKYCNDSRVCTRDIRLERRMKEEREQEKRITIRKPLEKRAMQRFEHFLQQSHRAGVFYIL